MLESLGIGLHGAGRLDMGTISDVEYVFYCERL